jgi:hypothetical protein
VRCSVARFCVSGVPRVEESIVPRSVLRWLAGANFGVKKTHYQPGQAGCLTSWMLDKLDA